jgi:hypothetical protein
MFLKAACNNIAGMKSEFIVEMSQIGNQENASKPEKQDRRK